MPVERLRFGVEMPEPLRRMVLGHARGGAGEVAGGFAVAQAGHRDLAALGGCCRRL
ncbi:MAG: hypothetical protein HWD60_04760 [Defluviicoccus sp.]|nr:MAG: hypothetical protein HWD60_04760 [Defluviicoccus sp.]